MWRFPVAVSQESYKHIDVKEVYDTVLIATRFFEKNSGRQDIYKRGNVEKVHDISPFIALLSSSSN